MSTGDDAVSASEITDTDNEATDTDKTEDPDSVDAVDDNPVREAKPVATAESVAPATGALSPKIGRSSGPLAARGLGVAKPASPAVTSSVPAADKPADKPSPTGVAKKGPPPKKNVQSRTPRAPQPGKQIRDESEGESRANRPPPKKVQVPNRRAALDDDIQAELDAALAASDVETMLSSGAGLSQRSEPLVDGSRVLGQVLKIHQDNVFIALGGPDEGVVPFEQFKEEPSIGQQVEVVIRGVNSEDGLFACGLPGGAIEASDWEDIEEGAVVEATVTGNNAGGLECKVGGIKGFIPISQISEYRVDDTSEFVNQKFLCVVTESNQRRGNLVLSRRAVLEREREEKRKEQLEVLEAGDELDGIVRSIKDFGAFVDLGGVDGLIHISKLSWDRVKHPSEVLEIGQKLRVKVDTIDKQSGKIGLSYRDLLDNPWDSAEQEFGVGTIHSGTVTRVANFGCFVKLGPGVEGLVHVSELAHHRVSKVDAFVSEGQQVEVKVLSFDRESQKIGLSIKAAQQAAVSASDATASHDEPDLPPRDPDVKPSHSGPLKGGNNTESGGERFGLRW